MTSDPVPAADYVRKITLVQHTLYEAVQFFEARDWMNARIHCSEVRWSPITEKAQEALKVANELWDARLEGRTDG